MTKNLVYRSSYGPFLNAATPSSVLGRVVLFLNCLQRSCHFLLTKTSHFRKEIRAINEVFSPTYETTKGCNRFALLNCEMRMTKKIIKLKANQG